MYAKYGKLHFALHLFERSEKNVVGWNAMISGYAQHGHSHAALALFKQMRMEKAVSDHFVLATVVSFCDTEMEVGKQLHAHVMLAGFHSDSVLLTALIRMYSASAAMDDARQLFDEMSGRDIISWTVMIAGYTQCGRIEDAFSNAPQRRGFMECNDRRVRTKWIRGSLLHALLLNATRRLWYEAKLGHLCCPSHRFVSS